MGTLQDGLFKSLQEISDYRDFETREKKILSEIAETDKKIKNLEVDYLTQKDLLSKLEQKAVVFEQIELHKSEQEITDLYNELSQKVKKLEGNTDFDILKKLEKERWSLSKANDSLDSANSRIEQTCSSLKNYGVLIQSQKLLQNDHSELNELNRRIRPQIKKEEIKLKLIEEMLSVLQRYPLDDVVPLINLTVREAMKELVKMKAKAANDRIFGLTTALNNAVQARNSILQEKAKIEERISKLTEQSKELKAFKETKERFSAVQEKYMKLQQALKTPLDELLKSWQDLKNTKGSIDEVKAQLEDIRVSIHSNKILKEKSIEALEILREKSSKKPLFEEEEQKIKQLYERITGLKENVYQWTQILQDPQAAKDAFSTIGNRKGFGLSDYSKFVKQIGEYLGNQFEPVAYDYKFHKIKFFNIEDNTFTTTDDRRISIDQLSQGQSKITTLTGSFKKMDSRRKKIVLVDEIADLDPENLQTVKNTLREKLAEGMLVLAVLVRPAHGPLSNAVEVKGWT